MNVLPLIFLVLLIGGLFWSMQRRRQQAATADAKRRESIAFGSEVMTTSGLYGTVTRVDDDDTVQLAIAPGIEVKWAMAALRDIASLPAQYRKPAEASRTDEPPQEGTAS